MPEYPLAVVTGGAHRLGSAFAMTLAYQGYAVLVHYHQASKMAAKTVAELKSLDVPAFSIRADLTQIECIKTLFDEVDSLLQKKESQLSQLAVLVNSAAVMQPGDAQKLPVEEWDTAIDVNLRAPFLCAQRAYPRMKRGGLIVNITDVGAQKVWSGFPSYTVSKAALESLTKVLARSFAPSVRVNAIAPGLVSQSESIPDREWKKLVDRLPLKRTAKTEEIASALEFLLKNEYVTGQTIAVDGGYSLL